MSNLEEFRRLAKIAKESGIYEELGELARREDTEETEEYFALELTQVSFPFSQFVRNAAAYTMAVDAGQHKLGTNSESIRGLLAQLNALSEPEPHTLVALNYGFEHFLEVMNTAELSLCRIYLISLVAAFEAYIHDVIFEIFRNYPYCMKNEQRSITYSEALGFTTLDELVDYLASIEAKKSIDGRVEEYLPKLGKRLGIDFDKLTGFIEDIGLVFALRNLLVHTDGIVDRQFMRRYPLSNIQLGDGLVIEKKNLGYISQTIRPIVELLEVMLSKKFPRIATVQWSEDLERTRDYAAHFEQFKSLCQPELSIHRQEGTITQD